MDKLRDRLEGIDFFLETQNLRPRERQVLLKARKAVTAEIKGRMGKALKRRVWQEMERRNPNVFMGERLTGGPRNIPGSEGGGVVIQPEQTPGAYIRDFVPNTSYRDPMIMSPDRPRRWRGGI